MQSRREFMNEALVLGAVAGAASRASAASPSSSTRKRDRFLLEPSQQFDLPHRAGLAIQLPHPVHG